MNSLTVNEIELSKEQLSIIENELLDINSWYRNGCDCGEFIIFLEDLGFFTLSTFCRKSSACSNDTIWAFDDNAYIYDKSVYLEAYDWNNINLKYKINKKQVSKLITIANESIKEYYGYDEFGEEI